MARAGMPPTTVYGGTSCVTTAPEATTAPSPTVIPGNMIALLQIQALFPIVTGAPLPAKLGEL